MTAQIQKRRALSAQSGIIWAEAAIAIPFFFGIMFTVMYIFIFCFRVLRFQYDVADLTRTTFASTTEQRNQMTWRDFMTNSLNARAESLGLHTVPSENSVALFSNSPNGSNWEGSDSVVPGDIFSIVVTLEEPILATDIFGVGLPNLTMRTKAIAVIQMRQNE